MKIIKESKKIIKEVVTALKNGAVLVLPTDTVYGLVCDATNKEAVEKIFIIKNRDKGKPLPVFVKDIKMAKNYAVIRDEHEHFLNKNWPGAVTVVLKSKSGLSPLVYKDNTIALRRADYKLVIDIMKLFKDPLAQTSANISGKPATTKIKEVLDSFRRSNIKPDFVIDAGDLSSKKPSSVVDLTGAKTVMIRQ